MPKLRQYALNDYIKAVDKLAFIKGVTIKYFYNKGSAVRFEVFINKEEIPVEMWVVHTNHSKKREVWSKEDYRKPEKYIKGSRSGEFIEILEQI
jgi:hypothetical protein